MKNTKRILISMLTIVLAVCMFVSTGVMTVFGASSMTNPTSAVEVEIPSTITYGESYDFAISSGDTAKVVAPNGTTTSITNASSEMTFDQVGVYTVNYSFAGNSAVYTKTILCELDAVYELRIKHAGADIPTYTEKNKEFTVPVAQVYFINDNMDEYEVLDSAKYTLTITTTESGGTIKTLKEGDVYSYSTVGSYILSYDVRLGDGGQYFSEVFKINVQNDLSHSDVKPALSVVGYSTSASLNKEVTLPIATATDDYDANVKVEVEVTFENEKVLVAVVDEKTEFATGTTDEEVDFDNKYVTSFYPTEIGSYNVKYTATSDLGNNSSVFEYVIKCEDRAAPILVDIAEDQIPSTWGLTSVSKIDSEDNTQTEEISTNITFPFPEYIDNSGEDGVTRISFEIIDSVNSQTVIKFTNIADREGTDNQYTYKSDEQSNGLYYETKDTPETYFFTDDGFVFNFANYRPDELTNNSSTDKLGSYTVQYQARDAENNITTKSYTIVVQETYEDTQKPDILVEFPKYVYFADEQEYYTVPTATITDVDTRVKTVYTLTNNNGSLEVTNGEKLEIVGTDLVNADEETLSFVSASELTFEIVATDIVGNETPKTETVTFITNDDINDTDNIEMALNTSDITYSETNGVQSLGSFTISGIKDETYRPFVGFELKLTNDEGVVIDGMSLETYYYQNVINVYDIKTELGAGTYYFTVRAFTITGKSIVSSYEITVDATVSDGGTVVPSSTNIGTSGSVNATYTLKNERFTAGSDLDSGKPYGVRKISNAGNFSLMGSEFTAYAAGSYNFVDGYYNTSNEFTQVGNIAGNEYGAYSFVVNDTTTTVFELQGIMPTYADFVGDTKQVSIELPSVIAHNSYSSAEIEINVKDPDGVKVTTTAGLNNTYSFTATKNGKYSVTYTASVGGSSAATREYQISVGDFIAPSFSLNSSQVVASTMTTSDSFLFAEMLVAEDSDDTADSYKNIKFTKTLYSPSGDSVYSISGWGNDYRANRTDSLSSDDDDAGYSISSTGTYEVVYTATDLYGNESKYREEFTVTSSGSSSSLSLTVLGTVLIIVAILLIAGIILYFVRFYKRKI